MSVSLHLPGWTADYKTKLTFYGFRYIRVNEFPGGAQKADLSSFTGIAVHSQMKRTGYIRTSDPMVNQLFSNIIWGQKSNFVDVPTDCPQRDERQAWTADTQNFAETGCWLNRTKNFLEKYTSL